MSIWRLAKNSIFFYWRTNLGVLLAALVGTAILVGALAVGDSVRYSLRGQMEERLGKTQVALVLNDRFIRAKLADEIAAELNAEVAPVLHFRGSVANDDGTRRANKIAILGVDGRFYKIGAGAEPLNLSLGEGVVLNAPLAMKLAVGVGDEVVLRVEKPGQMPRELPLSPDSDLSAAFRLPVKAIAGSAEFGRFSLQANQISPLNVFVDIRWLQEKLGTKERANMLLVASRAGETIAAEKANGAIRKCWQLGDADLEFRRLEQQGMFEIRSSRVFIDDFLAKGAMKAGSGAIGILTYFVNELRLGEKSTPYSMVAAIGKSADAGGLLPADMRDDEIVINKWLADDLGAKVGDLIEIAYFVPGPMRRLEEQKRSLRVRKILPMEGLAIDQQLMPDFPGIADINNCRDWRPGIPIELGKIRPQDEKYWQQYRGAPKAFVTLKSGEQMWRNKYGGLTAIRYPLAGEPIENVESKLLDSVDPAALGLFFQSVRERGVRASKGGTDFGWLFLGFSVFLIIAALILMGLVFVFGVESRSQQVGMLLAVGFTQRMVRRLMLMEGGVLALLGAFGGAAAGVLYTKAMIYGLTTGWQVVVGGSPIYFNVRMSTMVGGALGAVVIFLAAIWLTLRRQITRPARELLSAVPRWQYFGTKVGLQSPMGLWIAIVAIAGAAAILLTMGRGDSGSVSTAFFGAGALLLAAGIGLSHTLLRTVGGRWNSALVSIAGLGLRNSARRSGRSLAIVGMLACGIFLVVAVGANKGEPSAKSGRRDSGTGGFALFGESAIGILHDLNSKSGREAMGLSDMIEGVEIVQLRVRDGDDASCLNLNRAQMPRLLGVQPEELRRRGAFGWAETIDRSKNTAAGQSWILLFREYGTDVLPAVGDYDTVVWALGKRVGDEIEYVDERGERFRLRLVGILKRSILQGSIIIWDDKFVKRFPSENGYRMFLIDAPQGQSDAVAEKLSFAMRDFGLEVVPAGRRLAEFAAVENTYLSVFAVLGGLGIVLGSVGLGLVVLRNILERRGEFAMLGAVGFSKGAVKRMVFYEHWVLVLAGLVCGVVAALVAAGPAIRSPRADVPYFSLAVTIAAIAASGAVWIWLASVFALGGKMLEALRNE